jgi:hypothetical protein
MNRKPFLAALIELLADYRPHFNLARPRWLTGWLPSRGNVIFTLLMIALLVLAQSVGALPLPIPQSVIRNSQSTIAYQGRLADSAGAPLTGAYNMTFRLYDAGTGGAPLWEEQWTGSNGVKVSDGLFNVMLGSLTPLPISQFTSYPSLFLGITVGTDDEMAPRVQLGSVPFAVQALTVPDGSVTTGKIADGAVMQAKLGADVSLTPPDGSVTTAKIADGAVTTTKLNLENGNVGVGTTNPGAKLDVQGCGNGCTLIKMGSYAAGGRQYIQLDVENSDPPSTSCDEADEVGRMTFRGETATLFICAGLPTGATWRRVNLN